MKVLVCMVIALAACGDSGTTLTAAQLQDPDTCMQCHPVHYSEWSGSMHAYASVDPVFVAMNKRGQRETGNQLGTFCLKCHAPMAVELGLTDGTNFDPTQLPREANGVTCFFCHNVKQVVDDHNNGLVIDLESTTMHGGFKNPATNKAHRGAYDKLMDSDLNDSEMCGSCHDIVTPKGAKLERTFAEWKTTFFSDPSDPRLHLTCGACHMKSRTDIIADDPDANVKSRTQAYHEHLWPAIDQAMTSFANPDLMAMRIHDDLKGAVTIIGPRPLSGDPPGGICLLPNGDLTVRMDTIALAHSWPSGSAQDRRAWLEVKAYDTANAIVFQSGNVADGMDPPDDAATFGLWDRTYQDDAKTIRAHFFWDVAQNGIDSKLLKPPVTLDPTSNLFDHSTTMTFHLGALAANVDRIDARLRIRPFSYDVIDQLISSGDLDPGIRDRVPTLEIEGTQRTWTRATQNPISRCNPF